MAEVGRLVRQHTFALVVSTASVSAGSPTNRPGAGAPEATSTGAPPLPPTICCALDSDSAATRPCRSNTLHIRSASRARRNNKSGELTGKFCPTTNRHRAPRCRSGPSPAPQLLCSRCERTRCPSADRGACCGPCRASPPGPYPLRRDRVAPAAALGDVGKLLDVDVDVDEGPGLSCSNRWTGSAVRRSTRASGSGGSETGTAWTVEAGT